MVVLEEVEVRVKSKDVKTRPSESGLRRSVSVSDSDGKKPRVVRSLVDGIARTGVEVVKRIDARTMKVVRSVRLFFPQRRRDGVAVRGSIVEELEEDACASDLDMLTTDSLYVRSVVKT